MDMEAVAWVDRAPRPHRRKVARFLQLVPRQHSRDPFPAPPPPYLQEFPSKMVHLSHSPPLPSQAHRFSRRHQGTQQQLHLAMHWAVLPQAALLQTRKSLMLELHPLQRTSPVRLTLVQLQLLRSLALQHRAHLQRFRQPQPDPAQCHPLPSLLVCKEVQVVSRQ